MKPIYPNNFVVWGYNYLYASMVIVSTSVIVDDASLKMTAEFSRCTMIFWGSRHNHIPLIFVFFCRQNGWYMTQGDTRLKHYPTFWQMVVAEVTLILAKISGLVLLRDIAINLGNSWITPVEMNYLHWPKRCENISHSLDRKYRAVISEDWVINTHDLSF